MDNKDSQPGITHCLVDNAETNLGNNELLFSELTDLFHRKSNLWDLMFSAVKAAKMFNFQLSPFLSVSKKRELPKGHEKSRVTANQEGAVDRATVWQKTVLNLAPIVAAGGALGTG